MCLYPRLYKNPKYSPNAKNLERPPVMRDKRVAFVPVACGQCIECRKQKANEWRVRLHEELEVNQYAYFVTLTFSPENLLELCKKYKLGNNVNAVAGQAIRLFLERIRKETGKSIKHWLVTELGQNESERIHIHGILFPTFPMTQKWLFEKWQYGWADNGRYVNSRTINYVVKYILKLDEKHKNYVPQIFCSKGIGANYLNKPNILNKHTYIGKKTRDYYTLPNGQKVQLPIYYRNKLYTEEEREKLWIHKIDNDTRYVRGTEIQNVSSLEGQKRLMRILAAAQEDNIKLGYGDFSEEWKKHDYNITLKMLQSSGTLDAPPNEVQEEDVNKINK